MVNAKGFSLISLVVSVAILGILTLVLMNLGDNINSSKKLASTAQDEAELKNLIHLILNNPRSCRVSLAGNGAYGSPLSPVVFRKTSHDEVNASEGMDIAFYFSNSEGDRRGIKKLNGKNFPGTEDKSQFGSLTIESIKLYLPSDPGNDYSDQQEHEDLALVKLIYSKGRGQSKKSIELNFNINLAMSTGQNGLSSGETQIIACALEGADDFSKSLKAFGLYVFSQGSNGTPDPFFSKVSLDMTVTCPRSTIAISHESRIAEGSGNCFGDNTYENLHNADPLSSFLEKLNVNKFKHTSDRSAGIRLSQLDIWVWSICAYVKVVCLDPLGKFNEEPEYNYSCSQGCDIVQRLTSEQLGL